MSGRAALTLALASLALLAAAPAAAPASGCGRSGVVCTQVSVPLDATGQVPGQVSLHVEELKAPGPERGVMFLIAGGPGQAASAFFDLAVYGRSWRAFFPGYTLVAFDVRGSGQSGPLACTGTNDECAQQLGPSRAFYSTADNARDLDAVRQALGYDRVSLWGVSYGTEVALAYAQAFPSHTARLLLDSVVSPLAPDPFGAGAIGQLPANLDAYCAGSACDGVASYGAAVVDLANRLAQTPLEGLVRELDGGRRHVRVDARGLLALAFQTDLDPGLAAELPAAVAAARDGDARPLLRLYDLLTHAGQASSEQLDDPLSLATTCDDGPFPWQAATPVADRPALLQSALAALPASSFGGLGTWAESLGTANACVSWPESQVAPPAPAAYPDVPVLALSGARDLRTPRSSARSVVAAFPRGRLLAVGNAGHSVLTTSLSSCVARSVHAWLDGLATPQTCRAPRLVAPLGPFPRSAEPAGSPSVTGAVHESEASWLLAMSERGWQGTSTLPGLARGELTGSARSFTLARYGTGDGLLLSGTVRVGMAFDKPLSFAGVLHVTGGDGAPAGTAYLLGARVTYIPAS